MLPLPPQKLLTARATMIEAFSARDKQLQEHIDTEQRNNILSLELLKGQLSVFTEQKQSELLATAEGRLQATRQKLYNQVLADARTSFGDSRSSGEGAEQAFGKGGAPRERALFDARDYKIPELSADPSLAVFKKWKSRRAFLEVRAEHLVHLPLPQHGVQRERRRGDARAQGQARAQGTRPRVRL